MSKPKRRKCAYCGKWGIGNQMVLTPTGCYRSEAHFAHKKCYDRVHHKEHG